MTEREKRLRGLRNQCSMAMDLIRAFKKSADEVAESGVSHGRGWAIAEFADLAVGALDRAYFSCVAAFVEESKAAEDVTRDDRPLNAEDHPKGFRCPHCGAGWLDVIETRPHAKNIHRVRRCPGCALTVVTNEIAV